MAPWCASSWVPQRCAELSNEFDRDFFNPSFRGRINFHRPCFFPVTVIDPKGKSKTLRGEEDLSLRGGDDAM